MATRYYCTRKAPNAILRGPMAGIWNDGDVFRAQSDTWTYRIQKTKTTDGNNTSVSSNRVDWHFYSNQQGNYDYPFFWRWVTYPLQAQTLSGTFDICFAVVQLWENNSGEFGDLAVVRWKVHVYLANGQTLIPKATLINNYVDSVNLPADITYKSLVSPQTITPATAADGDIIVIELGVRIVSAPTPVPTYPPSENLHIFLYGVGAHPSFPDGIPGTSVPDGIPWIEFSANIAEQTLPAAPSNSTCATAIDIPTIPSATAYVDTTQCPSALREVWWKFVPSEGRILHITAHGSNNPVQIEVLTGNCAALSSAPTISSAAPLYAHRSQAYVKLNVTAGTQYFIRVKDPYNAGGLTRLNLFYQTLAYEDGDVFLANGGIFAFRNGQMINYGGEWGSYPQTGVGIDYTKRPILNIEDDSSHTGERLLIGLHDYELVELVDLYDLNSELGYIGDPWVVSGANIHPAQMHVTTDGIIHQAWFGNGYLYTVGSGNKPAVLNTISSVASYSALRSIDATYHDDQAGHPFVDVERIMANDITSPWAIRLDEANGIIYYTAGGVYVPVGGNKIKRYNINTNTQLADFATVPLQGTLNPGLKGLDLLPDGGLIVCNGTVITRLNSSGTVVQTYTPSIPEDAQTLMDVKLDRLRTKFWCVDLFSTRFFQFDVATGAELQTFQPHGRTGTLTQIVIYGGSSTSIPPTPPDLGGIYFINPDKTHDIYYTVEKKIPNPTIRTGLIGE